MKMKAMTRIIMMAAQAVVLLSFCSLVAADSTTVDDLSGLRPDTDGVQTNAFWDTRLHSSYTVQISRGVSTNSFDTAVSTFDYSNLGDPGAENGLIMIVR